MLSLRKERGLCFTPTGLCAPSISTPSVVSKTPAALEPFGSSYKAVSVLAAEGGPVRWPVESGHVIKALPFHCLPPLVPWSVFLLDPLINFQFSLP